MKPLPKTTIKAATLAAAAAKKMDAALQKLLAKPSAAGADAVLATTAKLPYDTDELRTNVEWQVLEALVERDDDAALRVWLALVTAWSARRFVGGTGWHVLARAKAALDAKLPLKLRARVREAWAWGIVSNVFAYTSGASLAHSPQDGSGAWKQGCVEITLQQFERAQACIDRVRAVKGYEYSAKCLEIMLHRERGDAAAARASYAELVALARKRKNYAQWDVIAAMFVILGVDDDKLAREIVTSWTKKRRNGESAIFES